MSTSESLPELRGEIEETTKRIFFLIARRLEIAREIGRLKARKEIPIYLPQAERKLRSRLSEEFDKLNVDKRFGFKILEALFVESRRTQQEGLIKEKKLAESTDEQERRRVTIIGGAGSMGIWLTKRLNRMGYRVVIYDTNLARAKKMSEILGVEVAMDMRSALQGSKIVFLSVPIRATTEILPEVIENAERGATVIEISSLKSRVNKKLRGVRRKDLTLLSIHPLFGPKTSSLRNKTLALCAVRDRNKEVRAAKELFKEARVVTITPADHDNAMSILLSLTHLASLAFISSCLGTTPSFFRKMPTTSFRLHLLAASSALSENPDLFTSIMIDNPETVRALSRFEYNFARLAKMVRLNSASELRLEVVKFRDYLSKILLVDKPFVSSQLVP